MCCSKGILILEGSLVKSDCMVYRILFLGIQSHINNVGPKPDSNLSAKRSLHIFSAVPAGCDSCNSKLGRMHEGPVPALYGVCNKKAKQRQNKPCLCLQTSVVHTNKNLGFRQDHYFYCTFFFTTLKVYLNQSGQCYYKGTVYFLVGSYSTSYDHKTLLSNKQWQRPELLLNLRS